jgi:hypothetical protein
VDHQGPVSNEAEFEHWLVSAFESERKRLRDHAPTRDDRDSRLKTVPDRAASAETKNHTPLSGDPVGETL